MAYRHLQQARGPVFQPSLRGDRTGRRAPFESAGTKPRPELDPPAKARAVRDGPETSRTDAANTSAASERGESTKTRASIPARIPSDCPHGTKARTSKPGSDPLANLSHMVPPRQPPSRVPRRE